jgi:hypothetical protein
VAHLIEALCYKPEGRWISHCHNISGYIEMGGTCSAYGGEESSIQVSGGKTGDPGADGGIILRWIFRKWDMGVWVRSS